MHHFRFLKSQHVALIQADKPSYRQPPSHSRQAGRPGSSKQAVTGKRKGSIKGTLTKKLLNFSHSGLINCTPDCTSCTDGSEYIVQRRFCRVPHQFAHLTVYLVQRGQNILYKGALGHLVRLRPLELARGRLEVDIAPQPACKLLGVHCSPVHVTVQLSKGQQGERPARLTRSKSHIALDGINLHQQTPHQSKTSLQCRNAFLLSANVSPFGFPV